MEFCAIMAALSKNIFFASLSLLVVFVLLEVLRPVFVTAFFNIAALGAVVFVSGALWILSRARGEN